MSELSAVINTEKMDAISAVTLEQLPGVADDVPVIRTGAGAVTRRVTEAAALYDYVFPSIRPVPTPVRLVATSRKIRAAKKPSCGVPRSIISRSTVW